MQLKKIEKQERNSVAPGGLKPAHSSENLLETKSHLIEELNLAKNIPGIKKLKEERAKLDVEMERKRKAELNKQFNCEKYVEVVPEVDATGQPIPPWKRQMLAKKAADKAKKEAELQRMSEEEERKQMAVPAWKRQLMLQKKDGSGNDTLPSKENNVNKLSESKLPNRTSAREEEKPKVVVQMLRPKSDSVPMQPPPPTSNHTGETGSGDSSAPKDAEKPANPWMFQLRKTNSKLFLNS